MGRCAAQPLDLRSRIGKPGRERGAHEAVRPRDTLRRSPHSPGTLEAWKPIVRAAIRMVQSRVGSYDERAALQCVVVAVNNLPFPLRPEES